MCGLAAFPTRRTVFAVGQGSGDYLNNYSYNTGESRAITRVTIR